MVRLVADWQEQDGVAVLCHLSHQGLFMTSLPKSQRNSMKKVMSGKAKWAVVSLQLSQEGELLFINCNCAINLGSQLLYVVYSVWSFIHDRWHTCISACLWVLYYELWAEFQQTCLKMVAHRKFPEFDECWGQVHYSLISVWLSSMSHSEWVWKLVISSSLVIFLLWWFHEILDLCGYVMVCKIHVQA